MRLKVGMRRVVWHGRSNMQHVVVVAFLEDLVKDALGRVVGDFHPVDLGCVPFGVDGDEVRAGFLGPHAAGDGVAGFEGLVDHGCADEAIGTGDEDVWHSSARRIRSARGELLE